MGDLAASVRTAGKVPGVGSQRKTIRRRKEFEGLRIFLPRVLSRHYATKQWRQFDYDRDLLSRLDWHQFSFSQRTTFTPDEKESVERTIARVSVENLGNVDDTDLSKLVTVDESVETELDVPALVRLLLDVIPNPWQGERIINETLTELRKRDISEERIFTNRLFLVKAMRDNLRDQVHHAKDDVLTINQLLQARWQEIQAFGDWQTDYESDEWAGYQPKNVWRGTTFEELRQGYFALKLHPLVIELQQAEPRVVPDGLAVAVNDAVVVAETTNNKNAVSQTPVPQVANDGVPAELLDGLRLYV